MAAWWTGADTQVFKRGTQGTKTLNIRKSEKYTHYSDAHK